MGFNPFQCCRSASGNVRDRPVSRTVISVGKCDLGHLKRIPHLSPRKPNSPLSSCLLRRQDSLFFLDALAAGKKTLVTSDHLAHSKGGVSDAPMLPGLEVWD